MTEPSTNAHEYTVSELSGALKRTVEDTYGHVRVRGELGRVTVAKSGHVYLDMKDERAVIDGVMWKGVAAHLNFRPEEGLEVIAEGKLSTFPGRSKYQLIIDRMEPAGEGALMALLEARKKALAAEGLFAQERKQSIPFLPRTIGVVTSPTGAVIRDILHRLGDRFPVHVLLWPVRVQGEGAAQEIATGIQGLNALMEAEDIPTPNLIIVARGGGSIEDLWAFNEEVVVRAAAASEIPLISAVGHETDTTLIDFASDRRAPTPTGAAEMAVPVRRELAERLSQDGLRLTSALQRGLDRKAAELRAAERALGRPDTLLQGASQRLDYAAGRLGSAAKNRVERAKLRLTQAGAGLRPNAFKRDLTEKTRRLEQAASRFAVIAGKDIERQSLAVKNIGARLEALSHKKVLARGFALVTRPDGGLVRSASSLSEGEAVQLRFADDEVAARIGDGSGVTTSQPAPEKPAARAKPKTVPRKKGASPEQGSLF